MPTISSTVDHKLCLLLLFLPVTMTTTLNDKTKSYLSVLISYGGGSGDVISHEQTRAIFQNFSDENSASTSNSSYWKTQCQSFDDILSLYNLTELPTLTAQNILWLSPAFIYNYHLCNSNGNNSVTLSTEQEVSKHTKPSSLSSWGFSFLFVTIINICSLAGVIVLPFMRKTVYQKILIFMVAVAVGSLAANGLLVLVPEALGLVQDPTGHEDFLWKSTTVVCGVYLFFLIERFLKIIVNYRKKQLERSTKEKDFESVDESAITYIAQGDCGAMVEEAGIVSSSIKERTPVNSTQQYKTPSNQDLQESDSSNSVDEKGQEMMTHGKNYDHKMLMVNHGHSHHTAPVKTVAWMIIFGDGLHNFIDGLSIGAAFTDSIYTGISISVAVICEELPHELGDFAILLNSGMSVKLALFYNFMSACMCYLGLVIGIVIGETTEAHTWIFAIAGGMFLYIALVDMMPEMNSAAESEEMKRTIGVWRIFIIQNFGLIFGFGVILIMSLYGGEIDFQK